MDQPLNILSIEDNQADFALIQRHVQRQGFHATWLRVDTMEAIASALRTGQWAVVLSDFNVPGLDFIESFRAVRAQYPDLPVILVSGTLGEERAVDLMKMGVTDFVLKDKPARLVPAIRRALAEVAETQARRMAEANLLEREAYFRSITESAQDAIITCDSAGIIQGWNPAADRMFGYEASEAVGKPVTLIVPDRLVEAHNRGFESHREHSCPKIGGTAFEIVGRRKGGDEFPLSLSLSSWSLDQNEFFTAIIRDISEAKKHQAIMAAVMAEKDAILENALVGIVLIRHRTIVSCNRRFEEIFGYDPGDPLGQSTRILYATEELFEDIGRKAYDVVGKGQNFEQELRLRRRNGELFWGVLTGRAIDPNQRNEGSIWIYSDISERKEAEQALRTLSLAVEQSPASVIITDPQGNIEYVNSTFQAVTGYSLEDVGGKNPRIFQSGLTPPETYQDIWRTILSGETWGGELQNRRKNGELYWEQAFISPIRSSDGVTIKFLAVKEDITLRKRAEEELMAAWRYADEANHAKTVFLSHMSHELRTPLTAILGYAEMMSLEMRGPLPRGYAGDIESIESSGRHLLSIIDDVLDISRIELGGYHIHQDSIDLATIMRESAAMLAPQCEAKGIDLSISDTTPAIQYADGKAVRQILNNLLSNAIKYTSSGGSVAVTLSRDSLGRHVITVADTGCGIPPEKMEQMFQPFQRADPLVADPKRGVGLGLTICRRIADLLGCELAIVSDVGRGTSISVIFGHGANDS